MSKSLRKIAIFLWYAIASMLILFAVFGVILKSLTPVLNKHKDYIENYVSDILHAEVRIESVQADWARFGPEVHFNGITLSEQGKTVIQAGELVVHVGLFKTLWRRSVFFRSIALSGADISIRETAPDQYLVNHVFLVDLSDQTASRAPEIFNWFVLQNHIHLTNIHLGLWQLNRGAVSLQLDQADVSHSSKGLSVVLEGSVLGEILGSNHAPRTFKSDVVLSTWLGLVKQKLTFAELEMQVSHLLFQEKGKPMRRYSGVEGVFLWQPIGENWLLQGRNVKLSKSSNESLDLSFELWRLPTYYAAHLNQLNLFDASLLANFLDAPLHGFDTTKANIKGSLEDIDIVIPQDFSAMDQYQFSGVLNNISSDAYGELPEVHHLSGAASGSVARGSFMLIDKNDQVYFANYFNQPVPIERLTASGEWDFSKEKLSLLFNTMHLISPALEAKGAMEIDVPLKPSNDQVTLSLLAGYHLKETQAAIQYLPMKVFSLGFSQWLTAALGHGLGGEGKVLIRGEMNQFPYPEKNGTFIVDGLLKPLSVSFSPDWPTIENISGNIALHNQTFSMNAMANAQGISLTEAKVNVPDYLADDPVVKVDLQASGEALNYLKFIQLSPLKSTIGQWLNPFDLRGPGALSLHLELPIEHLDNDHIKVNGQWLAQGARFSWKAMDAVIKNIKGAIQFTQNSISADHVSATLENEPLEVSIKTAEEKGAMTAIDIDVLGMMSVAQLTTLSKIDWLSFYLSGRSHYHAHLRVPMAAPEYLLSFDTNAQGMKINLPENLGKEAQASLPISLKMTINPDVDLISLLLKYTKSISATINVQHYSQTKTQPRILEVDASAATLSWPMTIPLPKTAPSNTPSLWQSLTALTLHVSHLSLYKNDFSSVILAGTRQKDSFSWKIQANEAQGSVVLPVDPKQPIIANFAYITLHSPAKTQVKVPPKSTISTLSAKSAATWSALFLNVQHFKRDKQDLGEVILQTSPVPDGILFKKMQISNPLYTVAAQGKWVSDGAKDTTYIEGMFTTKNVGDFLSQNNITKGFQAKAGRIKYSLSWLGSPMDFQLKNLGGDASLNVKDGVIPLDGDSAKMGLGKVLTLFSAQSIQRRFQLNFSDLGDNGYSFNSLISVLHFQSGNAKVTKGVFDGPEAKIGFTGHVGLAQKNYDLYIVVTPYLTSSLPLIATLAGGPIAGVATYAFDKIASGSIAKLTSYKYLLRGPWSQPQLISLDLEKPKSVEKKNIAPVEEAS